MRRFGTINAAIVAFAKAFSMWDHDGVQVNSVYQDPS